MTNMTIGEQLRNARTAQNLDLSQIAEETKISRFYLDAIESNQIDRLPGLFFYKAFVRQYCKYLNVDSKKLELQINQEHGAPEVSVEEIRQSRIPSFREPALRAANSVAGDMRLILSSIGLIAFLVGGSVIYTWVQRPAATTVITDSKQAYPAAPKGAESSHPQAPAATPVTVPAGALAVRQVADNLTPEAGPDSSVSLNISATESTWITITSDGKTVFTGVLEPQQSKLLAGKSKVMIRVGNAGGLEVKWNGKQIGKIGDAKQVRTLMFTEKEFQIMTPAAAQPANPISD